MTPTDKKYLNLLGKVLNEGEFVDDGRKRMFSLQNQIIEFEETPLVTIRKTAWKTALREMEWFLSGSTNLNNAHPSVHPWWEPWATESGDIRFSYGFQFNSPRFNQIDYLIKSLKENPKGRSNLITTWNTQDMISAPIHNCHGTVIKARMGSEKGGLELTMIQRSADLLLGVPHNWIQYWALGEWIVGMTNSYLRKFTWIGLDCHIYETHTALAHRMARSRLAKVNNDPLPDLYQRENINIFKADNFTMDNPPSSPLFTERPELIV